MEKFFARFASATAKATGSPAAFLACVALVVIWAVSGPVFKFSETWQLVINTGTTIITFLMVFLIQNTQNRDSEALHAKLDELILTSNAEDRFIGIESLSDKELEALHARCKSAAESSTALFKKADDERKNRARPGGGAKSDARAPRSRANPSTRRKTTAG